MQINESNISPSRDLYAEIRASFTRNHDSFTAWCKREGLNVSNVREAIYGSWNGPKGKAIRKEAIEASGLLNQAEETQ